MTSPAIPEASITQNQHAASGATITQASKPIPSNATVRDGIASWTDREGAKRTATVSGKRVVVLTAEWADRQGLKSAPVDQTESAILVVDDSYTADYTVGTRRVRKSTKVPDKAVAQRIANQWEADERLRAEGIRDAVDESLAKYGVMSIDEHLDAFIDFRATEGGTEEHRDRTRKHIAEFIAAGGWKSIRDISTDDVTRHVAKLKQSDKSARTIQARLQSIKSFAKWLCDHHRAKINPLSTIKKPNPESDRRHERRMILPDEWPWLVAAVAKESRVRTGMSAGERLLLYRTAIQTGLRASELHDLTRGNLTLSGNHPYIGCKSAGTKNKKPAQQFIDQALAADLAAHARQKHPAAPVFAIGGKDELSRTIQADLKDARRLWLDSLDDEERNEAEQSDFLVQTNHEGEHLVFHSLRHTCGAWLAMAGESIKVVQSVLRHSTPVLTLNTYGHLFPGQCEGAPVKLAAMMGDKELAIQSRICHIA